MLLRYYVIVTCGCVINIHIPTSSCLIKFLILKNKNEKLIFRFWSAPLDRRVLVSIQVLEFYC